MMENFSNKYSKSSNKLDICDTPSKSSPFSVPLEKEQFQVAFYQIYELEPNSISMWDIIKKQNIFYTYFFANQNFYLFLFYPSLFRKNLLSYLTQIQIIKKLDKKPRKIRSTSGFCRYALEIMESSNCKILKTNYDSSFWKKLRVILKRNQKASLTKFLNQTLGEKLRMKKLDRKPSKNLERVLKIRGGEQDLIVQNTKESLKIKEKLKLPL